jgi:hypothetical protein
MVVSTIILEAIPWQKNLNLFTNGEIVKEVTMELPNIPYSYKKCVGRLSKNSFKSSGVDYGYDRR